jgi:hypothetical protein
MTTDHDKPILPESVEYRAMVSAYTSQEVEDWQLARAEKRVTVTRTSASFHHTPGKAAERLNVRC